ncbi:MAG: NAD-dependent epimerase/dehydratase family protein [Anaerolineae bacterium]|nr:NAD-dependent epimerase/dehydratase family protein [Anaerolineae bacterium]MDW7992345.1 NAD-dependent epimerase/dehydratase family protein [Anaerolineae bacterium]
MVDFGAVFAGKPVLITGGLGFIGSNLAHRLVELGAVVTIVDALFPDCGGNWFNIAGIEDRVEVHVLDIQDEAALGRLVREKAFLFNLAGRVSHLDSMRNPYADLESNVRGHLSVLEACRRHNPEVKIVHAGTRQVYGRPCYLPVDESHPPNPVDINGVNKLAGELYHIVYHRAYGLRTASLRLTNTYGPRMWVRDSRLTFIGWWIRRVVEGQELEIFGDGRQIRDFNYVDDVVEALLLAAANPVAEGQIYNLGGEPISLLDLARLLVEVNGGGSYRLVPFPPERNRIDIGDFCGDSTRIRDQLGWRPRVSLREGLARTLAYYREYHRYYW